jgi:steroid 5-alpha reductase family enzyme
VSSREAGVARERRHGFALAVAPAILVVIVEGFAWIVAALTGLEGPVDAAFCLLPLGAVAGVVALILILTTHQQEAGMWCVVSVCATSLGLFFGFLLWLGAFGTTCGGSYGCFN